MFTGFKLPRRKNELFSSIEEFELNKKLGYGSFSTVYKATHKISKDVFAIKEVDFNKISFLDQENIQKEIIVNKRLKHKNVVKMKDFFQEEEKVYLVMEFCQGGNLYNYLSRKDEMDEKEIKLIFKQIVNGINYIHSKGYVNRDIKLENILLDGEGSVKICDFGWAAHLNEEEYRSLRAGTIIYMSPECLRKEPQCCKSDVWSLGVLLYELYHKSSPFKGRTCDDQLKAIFTDNLKFREEVDEELKKLIKGMLVIKARKRMGVQDILKSKYLKGLEHVTGEKKIVKKSRKSFLTTKAQKKIKAGKGYKTNKVVKKRKVPKDLKKEFSSTLPLNQVDGKDGYAKRYLLQQSIIESNNPNTFRTQEVNNSQQTLLDILESLSEDSSTVNENKPNNIPESKNFIKETKFVSEKVLKEQKEKQMKKPRSAVKINIKKRKIGQKKLKLRTSGFDIEEKKKILSPINFNTEKKTNLISKKQEKELEDFHTNDTVTSTKTEFDKLVKQYKKKMKFLY